MKLANPNHPNEVLAQYEKDSLYSPYVLKGVTRFNEEEMREIFKWFLTLNKEKEYVRSHDDNRSSAR